MGTSSRNMNYVIDWNPIEALATQDPAVPLASRHTPEPSRLSGNNFSVFFPPPTWADLTKPTVKVGRPVHFRRFMSLPTLKRERGPHGEEVSFSPARRLVFLLGLLGDPCLLAAKIPPQPTGRWGASPEAASAGPLSDAFAEEGLPEMPTFDVSFGSYHCAKISAANHFAGAIGAPQPAMRRRGGSTRLPQANLLRLGNLQSPVRSRFDCWPPGHPSTRATQPLPHHESPALLSPTRSVAGRDHTPGMTRAGDSPSFAQVARNWQAGLLGLWPQSRLQGSETIKLMAWVIWKTETLLFFRKLGAT